MSLVALRELYRTELNDLYDTEQQVLRELPLLAAGATSDELRQAFDVHYRETLVHVDRLDEVFRQLDERPRPVCCRPLRTIIEDARLRKAHLAPGAALDAALIAFGQRIEHFEIAAYRCARSYALAVGDANGADLLQQTLDEEGAMDQHLLGLTTKSSPLLAGSLDKPALVLAAIEKAS